jgi:hypothetical protein
MPSHRILPTTANPEVTTARLGAGALPTQNLDFRDVGKPVRLVGESRYDLAIAGQEFEGVIETVENATQDGFSIGSVVRRQFMWVTFDGLQATPGTGVVTVGDIVVCGTPTPRQTPLVGYARVCRATTPASVMFRWRIVSLGVVGTGAVGTHGVIERV